MTEPQKIELSPPVDIAADASKMLNDRAMASVPSVSCHKIPDIAILDQKSELLDLNVVKTHLLNEGTLSTKQIQKILHDGDSVMYQEPNLLEIDSKCIIIGDTHGQFYDVVSLIDLFDLSKDVLLFLGDYVDRGAFGVETYLYLLLLKAHYPKNIFLLRGNHECERMTTYFTFKRECIYKYDKSIYRRFLESFRALPTAAVVQKRAFCCHGGISPHMKSIFDINLIDRFKEIEYEGLFCDIFWADPHENYDLNEQSSWEFNNKRNCSVKFSYRDAVKFLKRNGLKTIIRAHEVQENGHRLMKMYGGVPSVVTVFSAPGYCDTYQNNGSYIEFDQEIVSIGQFEAVVHPYVINGFIDGINWSIPFISEKIVEFAMDIFDALDRSAVLDNPEVIATKIAMARAECEAVDEFEKTESPECNILSTSEAEMAFKEAEEADVANEMMKTSVDVACETPSMQNETLAEICDGRSEDEISGMVERNEIVVVEKDGKKYVKMNVDKRRWPCNYFCTK